MTDALRKAKAAEKEKRELLVMAIMCEGYSRRTANKYVVPYARAVRLTERAKEGR